MCGMRVVVLIGGIGVYDVYICIYICHNIICQNDDINDICRARRPSSVKLFVPPTDGRCLSRM